MLIHPIITVLMSVYNGERYLKEAIDSILTQTFTDFEFIIIDDASTDKTPEILNSYHDNRIKIIRNDKNIGLTKSLNKGLEFSNGLYIARMDADDVSLPDRFMKEVAFLNTYPEIAVVGTASYIIDQEGNVIRILIPSKSPRYCDFLKKNQIIHGSIMLRRSILKKYSGYDELFRYCQDYALWLQMAKMEKISNIQEILYKLRIHGDSISRKICIESVLYQLLAIKISKSSLPKGAIEEIKSSGIYCLIKYLNRNEYCIHHNSIAINYCFNGNLKSARREYWKIFKIKPWNILNLFFLFRTYLGKKMVDASRHFYLLMMKHFKYY